MMPLAYVIGDARGLSDRLLAEVAARLEAEGWALAGVTQSNDEVPGTDRCDMHLRILGRHEVVRISQSLGAGSSGCRLDPEGLEAAVGLVGGTLAGARLLIVNKFGKAEIEGRGFRALIGEALAGGLPVLTAVNALNLPEFERFAEGLAVRLPTEPGAVLDWCRAVAAATI